MTYTYQIELEAIDSHSKVNRPKSSFKTEIACARGPGGGGDGHGHRQCRARRRVSESSFIIGRAQCCERNNTLHTDYTH